MALRWLPAWCSRQRFGQRGIVSRCILAAQEQVARCQGARCALLPEKPAPCWPHRACRCGLRLAAGHRPAAAGPPAGSRGAPRQRCQRTRRHRPAPATRRRRRGSCWGPSRQRRGGRRAGGAAGVGSRCGAAGLLGHQLMLAWRLCRAPPSSPQTRLPAHLPACLCVDAHTAHSPHQAAPPAPQSWPACGSTASGPTVASRS